MLGAFHLPCLQQDVERAVTKRVTECLPGQTLSCNQYLKKPRLAPASDNLPFRAPSVL